METATTYTCTECQQEVNITDQPTHNDTHPTEEEIREAADGTIKFERTYYVHYADMEQSIQGFSTEKALFAYIKENRDKTNRRYSRCDSVTRYVASRRVWEEEYRVIHNYDFEESEEWLISRVYEGAHKVFNAG